MIKKILEKKKGSALIIIVLGFFAVFTLSFASGYLVFLSISTTSGMADNLKAQYAARAGVERAHFEAIKNNYDFSADCSIDIISEQINEDYYYSINCIEGSYYSLGQYKDSKTALEINCIDITEGCLESCLNGSLCGGGKLVKPSNLIISPSACNAAADNCDNSFSDNDFLAFAWDPEEDEESMIFHGASSTEDGLSNIAVLDPQVNTALAAAKYCDDLDINGYSDWYLPALDELVIISLSPAFYHYNLEISDYWTSTEINAGEAYAVDVGTAEPSVDAKISSNNVRCIRQ
jgi:hypothetical protein